MGKAQLNSKSALREGELRTLLPIQRTVVILASSSILQLRSDFRKPAKQILHDEAEKEERNKARWGMFGPAFQVGSSVCARNSTTLFRPETGSRERVQRGS